MEQRGGVWKRRSARRRQPQDQRTQVKPRLWQQGPRGGAGDGSGSVMSCTQAQEARGSRACAAVPANAALGTQSRRAGAGGMRRKVQGRRRRALLRCSASGVGRPAPAGRRGSGAVGGEKGALPEASGTGAGPGRTTWGRGSTRTEGPAEGPRSSRAHGDPAACGGGHRQPSARPAGGGRGALDPVCVFRRALGSERFSGARLQVSPATGESDPQRV